MSDDRYHCDRPRRLAALRDQAAINGLDYLEIANPAQTELRVLFAHPLPGAPGGVPAAPALTPRNFRITGGERIRGIAVTGLAVADNEVILTLNRAGDFSPYCLHLVTDASLSESPVPAGFDPWLSQIRFSFKAECPSDFDCALEAACAQTPLSEPVLNYLAKDYDSFRRLILDRMALQIPDWRDRNAADLQITLVELLAYLGDHLSQQQDAITPEGYLMTARLRRSVARHARLLDYHLGQGLNARCWAHLTVRLNSAADGAVLPLGTPLLTRVDRSEATIDPGDLPGHLGSGPTVFETMAALRLNALQNEMPFHQWSDDLCCLPKGATRAWLDNSDDRGLVQGDLVLLEESASPDTGLVQDADPSRRHVVRLTGTRQLRDDLEGVDVVEIVWDTADALPFPLCLSAEVLDQSGTPQVIPTGLARGNIVPADHGLTVEGLALDPPTRVSDRAYTPRLPRMEVVFADPFDPGAARTDPATWVMARTADQALPAVQLSDGIEQWHPRADLLRSRRFDAHFVAEPERNGHTFLRFGNHRFGKAPTIGTTLTARVRQGGGPMGNVGSDTLRHVVTALDGVERVRNPLPGQGGTAPEPLAVARAFAPQAYRTQRRAVIAEDYARVAEEDPDVQRAVAEHFWFGSWYTVVVTVDGRENRLVSEDTAFRQALVDRLETRRMAGVDVQLRDPIFLNLDLLLHACATPDRFAADVKAALIDRFSSGYRHSGLPGFFHPDNLTFGQPLYTSEILAAAMEVDGVASVRIAHLRRWGAPDGDLTGAARILPGQSEVLRLENNPNLPEHGVFQCNVEGGV